MRTAPWASANASRLSFIRAGFVSPATGILVAAFPSMYSGRPVQHREESGRPNRALRRIGGEDEWKPV